MQMEFVHNAGQLVTACTDDSLNLWDFKKSHSPELVQSMQLSKEHITTFCLEFQVRIVGYYYTPSPRDNWLYPLRGSFVVAQGSVDRSSYLVLGCEKPHSRPQLRIHATYFVPYPSEDSTL